MLGKIFGLEIRHGKEYRHDDRREHLQVIRLKTQENDKVIDDIVNNAAADNTDQAHHEVGLDL